jgi:hypothetical protein
MWPGCKTSGFSPKVEQILGAELTSTGRVLGIREENMISHHRKLDCRTLRSKGSTPPMAAWLRGLACHRSRPVVISMQLPRHDARCSCFPLPFFHSAFERVSRIVTRAAIVAECGDGGVRVVRYIAGRADQSRCLSPRPASTMHQLPMTIGVHSSRRATVEGPIDSDSECARQRPKVSARGDQHDQDHRIMWGRSFALELLRGGSA